MPPKDPHYPLREVQDLAKDGLVLFSPAAEDFRAYLGISLAAAKDVIACLELHEFKETRDWERSGTLDTYHVPQVSCPTFGDRRDLYVKLKIASVGKGGRKVIVCSFHTHRP